MDRTSVYALIDEERQFQGHENYNLGEELLLLHELVRRATRAYYDNHRYEEHATDIHVLNQVRKIAASAVRTMEHHGAPSRSNYEEDYCPWAT